MIYVITNTFPFALNFAEGLLSDVGFGKHKSSPSANQFVCNIKHICH